MNLLCNPVNPDKDIEAPDVFLTQLGLRPKGSITTTHNDTAFVYLPSGRCIGEMTKDTLDKLTNSFRKMAPAKTTTSTTLGLDEAMAQLLMRYQTPSNNPESCDKSVTPARFMQGLSALGVTHERFASPLDRSIHLPTFSSTHQEDNIFGSRGDAFAEPWSGFGFANPGKTHSTLTKVVRWAISSAVLLKEPVLNILLLPRGPESKHNLYLGHHLVYDMGTINKITFTPPDYWRSNKQSQTARKPDTSQYKLFAVANKAGMEKYLSNNADWARFTSVCLSSLSLEVIRPGSINIPRNIERTPYKHPKALETMIAAPPTRPQLSHKRCRPEPDPQQWRRPLAVDPRLGVYTDGSCMKQQGGPSRLGAAVRHQLHEKIHITSINPQGHGATNTINRAELSAIHIALTDSTIAGAHTDLIIYTDSQCSIQMINKMMYQPTRMLESKHLPLLEAIVQAIQDRSTAGGKTTIQKVKSHIGIMGNEEADKAASAVAKGLTPATDCVQEWVTPLAYQSITWPATCPDSEGDNGDTYYCNDLSPAIKSHLMPTLQAGKTNNSLYVQLNKKVYENAHAGHSNFMWNKGSNVPFQTIKMVFQARWGTTYHQGRAVQFKQRDRSTGMPLSNPACRLCGRPDGPVHTFAGCLHPQIKAHTISRHNKAVQIIHKAIGTGELGGSYCIVDATKQDHLPAGVASNRLPAWLLPNVDATTLAKLRPDILLVKGLPTREADGLVRLPQQDLAQLQRTCTILIIEIGYASEFRYNEKHAQKTAQHAELMTLLRGSGWDVKQYNVVLGIAATINRDVIDLLEALGVPALKKKSSLHELHKLGATKVRDMLTTRRKLQATLQSQTGVG